MDIVEYVKDPAKFIANALNPAEVLDVIFNEEKTASETEDSEGEETTEGQTERSCTVVVPDSQLSLAIGKRGQNARLAARLTKYKIDIKSESEMAENDQESEEVADSEENIDNNEE